MHPLPSILVALDRWSPAKVRALGCRAPTKQKQNKESNVKIHLMVVAGAVIVGSALTLCRAEDPVVKQADAAPVAESKAAAAQAVYVCSNCQTMALSAGACKMCGKEMAKMHVLGVKDGKVQVCACHAGCTCNAAGVKDGKCSCGKAVQEVSAKGMYVCACPDGKCCAAISDKPGKCACGAEMKKVE